MDFFGLLSPQLAISGDVCKYLTIDVPSLRKVQTPTANGMKATLLATVHVSTVKRPVIVGYQLRYTREGLRVVSLTSGAVPPCFAGEGAA